MIFKNRIDFLSLLSRFAFVFSLFSFLLFIILLFFKFFNFKFYNLDVSSFGSFYGGLLGPPMSLLGIIVIVQQYKQQQADTKLTLINYQNDKVEADKRHQLEFNLQRLDYLSSKIDGFEQALVFDGWSNDRGNSIVFKGAGRSALTVLSSFDRHLWELKKKIAMSGNVTIHHVDFYTSPLSKYKVHVSYDANNLFDIYAFLTQLYVYRDFIHRCFTEDNFKNREIYDREYDLFLRKYMVNITAIKNFCKLITAESYIVSNKEITILIDNLNQISNEMYDVFSHDLAIL